MDLKEQIAVKQIDRFAKYLADEGLHTSKPVRNEFSYQVSISDSEDKVFLQVFFGKKGHKIVLQGNKDLRLYKKVSDLIFGEKFISDDKPETEPSYAYIGTDESGKGDYFGPLVIAGVYIHPQTGNELKALGIRDSKELSDLQVKEFSKAIKNNVGVIFDIVQITPEKYNQLYEKMGNLNRLMGWAHARVIENLLSKCDANEAISDKFGNEKLIIDALQQKGRTINLTQITKAEKFIAVAAASIIARETVMKWFINQSKKYNLHIPKGSSSEVNIIAKQLLEKYGEETMKKLVKLHFKTSNTVFNN